MGWCESTTPVDEAVDGLVAGLLELNLRLEVPGPQAFGIQRDAWFSQLEHMAMQAEASGSPANNPRIPTQAEMVALYTEVWGNT
jgi:alcohol dehydrogenase class IV